MIPKLLPCNWPSASVFYDIHSILVVYCVIQSFVNYLGLSPRCYIQFDLAELTDVNNTPVSKDTKDELSACDSILGLPFTPLPTTGPAFSGVISLLMQGGKTFTSLRYREELPPFRVTFWSIARRLKSIVGDDNWEVLILDSDSYVNGSSLQLCCLPLTNT